MTGEPSSGGALPDGVIEDLIGVGRDLWEARLVSSHGGNLSFRQGSGCVITRHGAMLHRLTPDQFIAVDSRGRPANAGRTFAPSTDTAVHLAVYREVPAATVVAHAHPVYAVAQSLEWGAITPTNLGGDLVGRVPVLRAVGDELPAAVSSALRDHPIVLVRGHGAFARADEPWEALKLISVLEEAAMILYLSAE